MADVAKEAGVSIQTVSRVLNDHPYVKADTRERVLDAVSKLSYRRDALARALKTRRSRTLGVLAFDMHLHGPASTLFGMQEAAREAGYFVSIASLNSTDQHALGEALEHLAEQSVEGIVVIAPDRTGASALDHLPADLPIVSVEGPHRADLDGVGIDQVAGARAATEHLLDLGHETVHHISGPESRLEAGGRREGWRRTLESRGAPVPAPVEGDWTPRSGHAAGRVLAQRSALTAVFVANDQMALGLLQALRDRDISVPEQVSVVGFDDIPESEYFAPPLTTLRQDFIAVGRRSIEMILERIDEPERERRSVLIPPRLVIRSSTTAPPT